MGFGGAQLGKAVKGKSKERRKGVQGQGDGKKSARSAAADKALGEEMRMLEEYEKMNKMAEAQKQRLKKLLQQESFNTRLNQKLITNFYRSLLRLEKVDLLRKEIDMVAQNHQRDIDRKDAIIHMLAKDLEEAEEQFATAQRSHLSHLSHLVSLNSRKLATVESEFERDLSELKHEFLSERAHLLAQHQRESEELRNVIKKVEADEAEKIAETKQAHETEREEIRNKNLESINELRIQLENKIEDLERQFDEAHANYIENTSAANDNFKRLKAEDAQLSLHIFEKKKKIARLQAQLSFWRKKLEFTRADWTRRNDALKSQRDSMSNHCQQLKNKMNQFRKNEAKRLTELTTTSREALQANQESLGQAERLLLQSELSRKWETEREKVCPFYEETNLEALGLSTTQANGSGTGGSGLSASQTIKAGTGGMEETKEAVPMPSTTTTVAASADVSATAASSDPSSLPLQHSTSGSGELLLPTTVNSSDGQPIRGWHALDQFYKRYNKVLLDKIAIGAEKKRLQAENADLKALLKQYLDGVAITSDALDKDNPLLIVNGRINLVDQQLAATQLASTATSSQQQQVRRGKPRTTQEMSQVVHNYTLQATGTVPRMRAHG